uniref:Reverse transcriptase zinc-binding domain-containing protein n=1 Tax=Tanacetum cinerariifolium TaxID=118510 RepID=A0A6L2KW74_TANCI|nr:hypothetical protein [Tanacetum cinerariifolium]
MSHRGGEIDQDAEQDQVKSPVLKDAFLKMNDMVEKEVYNELLNRFLQLKKHCISLEISIQQKEESFQSNKPCKNQDSPKFREFFEINELKAQLRAKNLTINNLKKQIKNVHEKSNESKVKHDIDVIETINIEFEHKVAKLLKENETLKKHYKDLYDSIKVTITKTIEQTTSLIAKNDECKAQLQEKVFTIAALKNELRKLKGNSVDTKFSKPSILGKPILQPPRNQSVVRQLNAFKSERPNFSKQLFSFQVDVNNVLSKPVTPHYLPKVREYVIAKPHHVIAPGSSRNSQEESYGSNDMAHNHYNCVFNANHDDCITKLLKEVNFHAKVQSLKFRNNIKPAKRIPNVNKPKRWISIGYRLSTNQSFAVHEKLNTPRSCLRWKLTGGIFKIAGLRWIPNRKMFTDNTTKVDSKPPNGLNDDITNPYECDQTLNVSPVPAPVPAASISLTSSTTVDQDAPSRIRAEVQTLQNMSSWLAVISDCNSLFNLRKACRQKDSCS